MDHLSKRSCWTGGEITMCVWEREMIILVANWLYSHTYYSSSPVLPSPHNTCITIIFVAPGLYFSSKTIISAAPGLQQTARLLVLKEVTHTPRCICCHFICRGTGARTCMAEQIWNINSLINSNRVSSTKIYPPPIILLFFPWVCQCRYGRYDRETT